jgi:hypothetical protein
MNIEQLKAVPLPPNLNLNFLLKGPLKMNARTYAENSPNSLTNPNNLSKF